MPEIQWKIRSEKIFSQS